MSFLFYIFAFLFGSIPWGYLIGKAKGVDLRKIGSRNIGATNVLRTIGKKEALVTLLLDISKGFIPVLLVQVLYPDKNNYILMGTVGILAIIGHCFTPFLKFKGGKGVATSLGVILAYTPFVGILTLVIWIIIFKISKVSSLSALVSFGLLPLNVYIMNYSNEVVFFCFLITVIIYLKHIPNIKRLLKGTETKIGDKL